MNNRGIALILCYTVILVLTIFASAFVTSTISDNNITTRQTDSTKAFWIAEAGLNQAYYNWKNKKSQPKAPQGGYGAEPINFATGTYTIDASNLLAVKVTGTSGSAQRTLQASFLNIPEPFKNTLSVGGDLKFEGKEKESFLKVYGKTRISGKYDGPGPEPCNPDLPSTVCFENIEKDKKLDTTIEIPDYNGNRKTDEYGDFVQMGREIVKSKSYPANEVIYLQTDGNVVFTDQSKISGKKVVFVEGSGDVSISFSSPLLNAGDDITVISTGDIFYQSSYLPANTRLNTISWGAYHDADTAGPRAGVIYTHDAAIWKKGSPDNLITGNVIANQGIFIQGNDGLLQFNYSERVLKGDIPPGFKWLFGTQGKGESKLLDWQEAE